MSDRRTFAAMAAELVMLDSGSGVPLGLTAEDIVAIERNIASIHELNEALPKTYETQENLSNDRAMIRSHLRAMKIAIKRGRDALDESTMKLGFTEFKKKKEIINKVKALDKIIEIVEELERKIEIKIEIKIENFSFNEQDRAIFEKIKKLSGISNVTTDVVANIDQLVANSAQVQDLQNQAEKLHASILKLFKLKDKEYVSEQEFLNVFNGKITGMIRHPKGFAGTIRSAEAKNTDRKIDDKNPIEYRFNELLFLLNRTQQYIDACSAKTVTTSEGVTKDVTTITTSTATDMHKIYANRLRAYQSYMVEYVEKNMSYWKTSDESDIAKIKRNIEKYILELGPEREKSFIRRNEDENMVFNGQRDLALKVLTEIREISILFPAVGERLLDEYKKFYKDNVHNNPLPEQCKMLARNIQAILKNISKARVDALKVDVSDTFKEQCELNFKEFFNAYLKVISSEKVSDEMLAKVFAVSSEVEMAEVARIEEINDKIKANNEVLSEKEPLLLIITDNHKNAEIELRLAVQSYDSELELYFAQDRRAKELIGQQIKATEITLGRELTIQETRNIEEPFQHNLLIGEGMKNKMKENKELAKTKEQTLKLEKESLTIEIQRIKSEQAVLMKSKVHKYSSLKEREIPGYLSGSASPPLQPGEEGFIIPPPPPRRRRAVIASAPREKDKIGVAQPSGEERALGAVSHDQARRKPEGG